MKNWFKRQFTHGLSKKTLIVILVLACVDVFSMSAPYYLKYVIPHIWTYLNIKQDQFDSISATMGWIVIATQLPSGFLADKFSGRRLLLISVLMTGTGTVLFGLASQGIFGSASLVLLYIVFVIFGISTTLFMWSPLWTVLSQQGTADQQGSLYGLQGSYNGLLGLIFITLIGTIATNMASHGNNVMFYVLVYVIAAALFITAWGVIKLIPETYEKSAILLMFKRWFGKKSAKAEAKAKAKNKNQASLWDKTKETLAPLADARVWMTAFFVLGMYMFQSVFAYYLNTWVALVSSAVVVTAIAGFKTYGLRLLVSGPFGTWFQKRKSYVFVMIMTLATGLCFALLAILLPGVGNTIKTMSSGYHLALEILFPILFIVVGIFSWFLVVGRYAQIAEIPNTPKTYGTIVAIISFIAFSSDAWFYQMASSLMKQKAEWMDGKSYSQAGLQVLLFIAFGIAAFGILCGISVFMWNRHEMKKLGKTSYRWRGEEEAAKASKTSKA